VIRRVRDDLEAFASKRDAERRAAEVRAANEAATRAAEPSPGSLEQAIAAAGARQREAEQKSEQQVEREHAARAFWMLQQNERKLERQAADLLGAGGDRREVEGRAPVRLGLPPQHEVERSDTDPFDERSR
jgi:hypothetical protein